MKMKFVKSLIATIFGALVLSSVPLSFATWNAGGGNKEPVGASADVTPTAGNPVAYYDSTYFASVEAAVRSANSVGNKTVYVIPGVTTDITSSFAINSGVTLCLPYEGTTWDYGTPTSSGLSDSFIDTNANNVNTYRVTHLNVINSTITVNSGGKLYIGGKFRAKGICGKYTQISLDQNSHISVSGTMINYGYIKETNGKNPYQSTFDTFVNKYNNEIDSQRYIEVLSGGVFRVTLAVYSSLSASLLEGLNSKGICPTDTFDFPNTQTYLRIYSGGTLEAQAKIYVSSSVSDKAVDTTATIICNQSIASSKSLKPLFFLESGYMSIENCPTNVEYSNVNSKSIINVNGTVNMGYLYMNLEVATIDTSSMFLPLSYKIKTILSSGSTFTSNYQIKLLAGSSLLIQDGATANLNSSTILYKSNSMKGLSTTYPENLDDALCVNNGSIIFGSSAKFGGHISTTAESNTALINTTSISLSSLSVTSYEGTSKTAIKIYATGDFFDSTSNQIESKLIDGGQTILSRSDGMQCWANGYVDSYVLTINVVNTDGYAYPAAAFKVYGYNSSGGSETLLSSADKFEVDMGTYTYFVKGNEQFKVVSLARAKSNAFTEQNGSNYTFTSGTKYTMKGNIELTITAGEGIMMWFTSSGQSGNGGSTKTVSECATSNGTFETLLTGGASGSQMNVVIGKNQYFKYVYTKGTGTASFSLYKKAGHDATTTTTEGWTQLSSSTSSPAVLADAEYTLLAYAEAGSCLLPSTLVTMADGTQKAVKDIVQGDLVKVFNHETGEIDVAPITFNDHDAAAYMNVLYLNFSNGKTVGVIYEHGFFDLDTMRYEYITEDNYRDFIGHRFYTEEGGEAILLSVDVREEMTECYSPTSFYHFDYFVEGMLSMPGGITGLFNIFEFGEDLKYDEEAYNRDIETYGLFTYEDLAPLGVTEIMFEAYAGKYLKVALGKGILTEEYLEYLIERYGGFTDEEP